MDKKYSLGIDLGTTNSALGVFDHENEEQTQASSHEIRQHIDVNVIEARSTLPSFGYVPLQSETEKEVFKLPWTADASYVVGLHAQKQGEKLPQRVVNSAKSWLCAADGQRHKNLPLTAPEDVNKLSSVEASSRYLSHLKASWNHSHADAKLEDQQVVITVPASFDAVARDLTLESARMAGLGEVTLLEEPIAAFYSWLSAHQEDWREQVQVDDVVLVCDIGGGTTDFSLITVSESEGNLELNRIAVGEHILLGGDNMDLALAYQVQLKLEEKGKKLEQWQFFGLAHSCRKAKESLLSDPSLDKVNVVIPSRGSKLLGGTLSSELTRDDVNRTILEGFLAECSSDDHPQVQEQRLGLRTLGLNYASETNVLKHLAKFLTESLNYLEPESSLAAKLEGKKFLHPTTVLFNGGVSKSSVLQDQIVKVLNGWLTADGAHEIKTLNSEDPDLAVSLGAAYYGSVCRGEGIRIKSATAFSYYIGVESSMPAIPGMPALLNGLCVVPVGVEESQSLDIPQSEFGLLVGEPVTFRFFISHERPQDEAGQLLENAEASLEELSALELNLSAEELGLEGESSIIPVKLRVHLTELGALEVWCDAVDGQGQWKLEFSLRED